MSMRITMVCAEAVQTGGGTEKIRLTGTPRVGSRSHWQSHVNQINSRNGFHTLNARKTKRIYPSSAESNRHQCFIKQIGNKN